MLIFHAIRNDNIEVPYLHNFIKTTHISILGINEMKTIFQKNVTPKSVQCH